jgi:hypothetical protein
MAVNGGGRATSTDTVYTDLSANTESDDYQKLLTTIQMLSLLHFSQTY